MASHSVGRRGGKGALGAVATMIERVSGTAAE